MATYRPKACVDCAAEFVPTSPTLIRCAECRPRHAREMRRAEGARYYARNRDKCKARTAKWQAEHRAVRNGQLSEWAKKNREQLNAYKREDRRLHPEKYRDHDWKSNLWSKFRIRPETYLEMYDAQGGVCAICKQACTRNERLSIDHDHLTGQIRALLCNGCNLALGSMREDPDRLIAAAAYLRGHHAKRESVA